MAEQSPAAVRMKITHAEMIHALAAYYDLPSDRITHLRMHTSVGPEHRFHFAFEPNDFLTFEGKSNG